MTYEYEPDGGIYLAEVQYGVSYFEGEPDDVFLISCLYHDLDGDVSELTPEELETMIGCEDMATILEGIEQRVNL